MKNILNRIILFAIVYALTFYVANFSISQSIVLSILLTLIVPSVSDNIKQRKFTPFALRIEPNYAAILVDAGLLASESDWWKLVNPPEEAEKVETDSDEIEVTDRTDLREGVGCYVLSCDQDSGSYAVAWPTSKRFTSQIDYSVEIDCITRGSYGTHPRLKIKPWKGGYRIQLNVSTTWFEEGWLKSIQAKLNPEKDEDFEVSNYLTGTVDLTMAIIPAEEFLFFYWDVGSIKKRKAALAKHGWVEAESNWELRALGDPVELSHKYAKILHREI
jgi:predicted membrane protein